MADYKFIMWLIPYIKPRSTKTNLPEITSSLRCDTFSDDEVLESIDVEGEECFDEGCKEVKVVALPVSQLNQVVGEQISLQKYGTVGGK